MTHRILRAALAAALLAGAAPAAALDLAGTWYVLVHYKDSAAHNKDAERWEDRVWVFEREGDALRWLDYPLVVLSDESGRFEHLGGNRASRKLGYWTPSPAQQAEIARGPRVNSRGSKSKTLRAADGGGWQSTGAAQPQSASFITYEETWSVTGPADRPTFTRVDSLGGGMAGETEGRTLYETTETSGDTLRGRYDRDGTRQGTFTMTRVGAAQRLAPATEEHQRERLRQHGIDQFGRDLGVEEE